MRPKITLQSLALELKAKLMRWVKRKKTVFTDASYLNVLVRGRPPERHNLRRYKYSLLWWRKLRHKFKLYISELIITELGTGTIPEQIRKRLYFVKDIEALPSDDKVTKFAEAIMNEKIMRRKASNDAYHIAICCVKGVDYLLTLNMKDTANEHRIRKLNKLARKHGYKLPKILTPEQFIVLYNRGEL